MRAIRTMKPVCLAAVIGATLVLGGCDTNHYGDSGASRSTTTTTTTPQSGTAPYDSSTTTTERTNRR